MGEGDADLRTHRSFYSGPLRGIFSSLRRANLLRDVQTLVLDGLSVTAELVHEIINDPSFFVRILSIRGVRNMNENKLRQALEYACRSSRADDTPRLRGLYVFGPKDGLLDAASQTYKGVKLLSSEEHAKEAWYVRRGAQFAVLVIGEDWANTLAACQGIIAFDAALCCGLKHQYSTTNPGSDTASGRRRPRARGVCVLRGRPRRVDGLGRGSY